MSPEEYEIEKQVTRLFAALNATDTLFPVKNKGNRYEVYTYLRLARLLRRFTVNFRPDPQTTGTFRFKAAPSPVNNAFSYYCFEYKYEPFELRNGTEFQGHGMCHEVDISVSTPLASGSYGPHPALRLAIECKYHSNASGLKGLLRSQVGSVLDLNGHHHDYRGCLHCGQTFRAFFASQHPMNDDNGYLSYLQSYHVGPLFHFQPGSRDRAAMFRLVQKLLPKLIR